MRTAVSITCTDWRGIPRRYATTLDDVSPFDALLHAVDTLEGMGIAVPDLNSIVVLTKRLPDAVAKTNGDESRSKKGQGMKFDDLNAMQRRLHNAACVLDGDGDEWGFVGMLREAIDEIERYKNQTSVAKQIVAAGVELMHHTQVGQWAGVRSFLEQETGDYEPFETPNGGGNGPAACGRSR